MFSSGGLHLSPTEILVRVVDSVPDLPTLLRRVDTVQSFKSVYGTFGTDTVCAVLASSGIPLQLQSIMASTLNAHQKASSTVADIKSGMLKNMLRYYHHRQHGHIWRM